MNAKKWSEQKQNVQAPKNHQEPPDSPPEPPGTDAGRPGVDFPPVFIQIHGNLTDFKPKNLTEGPGESEGVATPLRSDANTRCANTR